MPVGRRAKPEVLFNIGDPVIVTAGDEHFEGIVKKFKSSGRVRIVYSSGGDGVVDRTQLQPRLCDTLGCGRKPQARYRYCDVCLGINHPLVDAEADDEPEDVTKKGGREMGFVQYKVRWEERTGKKPKYFHVNVVEHDLMFYGWWRKTRAVDARTQEEVVSYAIDIFARRTKHDYTLEPIYYATNPLKDYKSLNADICAAMNKFLHQTVNGHAENLDTLQAKARFPVLTVKRLATIDRMILKLREIRDTAIRAGGQRLVEIRGDAEDSPTVRILIDVSTQSFVLKGKVPSLEHGAIYDTTGKRGEPPSRSLVMKPSPKNVEDLVAQLKAAKKAGDKSVARKLRAVLRKMGHRGGARSLDKAKNKKSDKE